MALPVQHNYGYVMSKATVTRVAILLASLAALWMIIAAPINQT